MFQGEHRAAMSSNNYYKEYYQRNKEAILERKRQRYSSNKEMFHERNKVAYEKTKTLRELGKEALKRSALESAKLKSPGEDITQ